MTSSADAQLTLQAGGARVQHSLPMAADVEIFQGSGVGLNSSGYAKPFESGDRFVGHAVTEGRDNTGGGNGDQEILVEQGTYRL